MSITGDLLFKGTVEWLSKGLDAASLRQQVIAENLANVETPGYKRKTVEFEAELQKAIKRPQKLQLECTHPRHISGLKNSGTLEPTIKCDRSTSMRNDGNNVDLEGEMASLAANALTYRALLQQLDSKLSRLRTVINEGRR